MAEFNISSVKTTDPGDIYGILCVGVDNTGTLLDPIAFITSFTETDPVFTASPAAGVTSQKITNWDTAFGWGNHASAGYLLSATAANTYQPIDGDLTAIGGLSGTSGILRKTAANTWALDTNTYLTSFTETDPVFTASPAFGVTSQKITNWDTAFGWGNHASAGYQSALGFTPLNRAGDSISATNGSGFIGYPSQSGTPSTPSSGFRFYANASHALSWVGQNGFTRTFDGSANTADRTYTLPDASGTIALEGTLTSLANPTIQNTYYQFVQNTAPTQRAVGVPLVAGDRWFKPIDNGIDGTRGWWIWTGSLWVTSNNYVFSGYRTSGISAPNYTTATPFCYPIGESVLLSKVSLNLTLPAPGDASNYYNLRVLCALANGSTSVVFTSTTKYFADTTNATESLSVLVPLTIFGLSVIGVNLGLASVGTIATPTIFSASCIYRRVHP